MTTLVVADAIYLRGKGTAVFFEWPTEWPSGRKFSATIQKPSGDRFDAKAWVEKVGSGRAAREGLYFPDFLLSDFPIGSRIALRSDS